MRIERQHQLRARRTRDLAESNAPPLTRLTKRQTEVLSLMAKGYSNRTIARLLVLEEKSVENHINAIFGHLNLSRDTSAHARVKAVLLYLDDGDADRDVTAHHAA